MRSAPPPSPLAPTNGRSAPATPPTTAPIFRLRFFSSSVSPMLPPMFRGARCRSRTGAPAMPAVMRVPSSRAIESLRLPERVFEPAVPDRTERALFRPAAADSGRLRLVAEQCRRSVSICRCRHGRRRRFYPRTGGIASVTRRAFGDFSSRKLSLSAREKPREHRLIRESAPETVALC
jgi:hypothetical protein